MKYYFFKTSNEMREGKMKPTLRALPGQVFEDGTPVDTNLNVKAPKAKGQSVYGSREDYPIGTVFCCDHLEVNTDNRAPYYTVYKSQQEVPNFHPVSDDPCFKYINESHKDDMMNLAYMAYKSAQEIKEFTEPEEEAYKETTASLSPADENGFARDKITGWAERYQGQREDESYMFGEWMKKLFADKKISLPSRIVMGQLEETFNALYEMGETIDTLASRTRFEAYLQQAGLTYGDFGVFKDGPHKKYLEHITEEHNEHAKCSATERNPENAEELLDASVMLCRAHDQQSGKISSPANPYILKNLKKALKSGWTLDEMLDPENLKKADSYDEYAKALADGTIPAPERLCTPGTSFIETLLADKRNAKPKDKDGFHVDSLIWKVLVNNLYSKTNTLLLGPTGSGKTEVIKRLCQQTGTPLTIVPMGTISDPNVQLVGKLDIDSSTGGTKFDWAEFALAIQRPGVILLDEINRIPKNGENLLFSCLDDTRMLPASEAKSSDQRTIEVHPECIFFATANIGNEYTGTKSIDRALRDRFMAVRMKYLNIATEKKILMARYGINDVDANNISFVANQIRIKAMKDDLPAVSTRETLLCARLVKNGFECLEAMELVFLPMYDEGYGQYDATSEMAQIKTIIASRFNNQKRKEDETEI